MNKRRHHISVILMLLAIVAVAAFQIYWLNKNYREEKQLLGIHTNILFHDAMDLCRAAKLKLDSPMRVRGRMTGDAVKMTNVLRRRAGMDSVKVRSEMSSTMIISLKDREGGSTFKREIINPDSPKRTFQFLTRNGAGGGALVQLLENVDSLQDSVTINEVSDEYSKLLKKENIDVPFTITKKAGVFHDEFFPRDIARSNEITLGFKNPVTYKLSIDNTGPYILKKLTSSIIVSVLLIGLTVLSFVLLLRNLMQQRKLTRIKNEFISNITHELKTPIATVSVAIEALKNFNALSDPQRTREYLDISGNELQRLSLLVDKVLKLSMFEKQQIEVREEYFDLRNLIEEVLGSMRLQFEKFRAQVHIVSEGEQFAIKADRLHITSVIFNLLDNALKYSKANPAIEVGLRETETSIVLSVTDNGVGISPEYKKKIFEKFFRVPEGDTHNVKGYGLGLSYVAHVVTEHRGTIELESQPGIGSKFIITLPKPAPESYPDAKVA